MKCLIKGKIVEAKIVEKMGYQGGYQVRAVEFEGKEYIVVNDKGVWRRRTVEERFP
jgi:hypothetical protein